jgi:ATP-dependent RNA helicase MSS116, mitochondrial
MQLISEGTLVENFKIMVFCNTANATEFMAAFFRQAGLPGALVLHSRMSQPARTRSSNAFRKSTGGHVLFTSDVSARGVDYPGTSLIIQVGLPSDREAYVHRLGRTARAGSSGHGVLLLCEHEMPFVEKELRGLPIKGLDLGPLPSPGQVAWFDDVQKTLHALDSIEELEKKAAKAYVAYLGFMNTNLRRLGWDKPRLAQEAQAFAQQIGLGALPAVSTRMLAKSGLAGVEGIRVATEDKPRVKGRIYSDGRL